METTPLDLKALRATLVLEKENQLERARAHEEEAVALMDTKKEAGNRSDAQNNEGDNISVEYAQLLSMASAAKDLANQAALAIIKIDNGTYGTCKFCHRPISPARLEVLPHSDTCVDCAGGKPGLKSRISRF